MPAAWPLAIKETFEGYVALPEADFPSIALALDDGIDDSLRDSLAEPSPVNPRYVEDLLGDCVNRVANCLILKEKANEVEVRAVNDALNYKVQNASLSMAKTINDLVAPVQERLGMNAFGTKRTGDEERYFGDEKLWQKVRDAQALYSKAQSEAIEVLRTKASTTGNGSNFVERFRLLKALFELGIVETYRRCVVCSKGLKAVYGIDVPVPKVKASGFLNELAIWAQKASDALDVELDGRYFGELTLAIAAPDEAPRSLELMPRTAFNAALTAGVLTFGVKGLPFDEQKMKSVLLRSVRLQVRAKTDDAKTRVMSCSLRLPGENTYPCTASTQYQDSEGSETVHGVHNLSPVGDWAIKLPERFLTGEAAAAEITNLYLFLRVSYRRT